MTIQAFTRLAFMLLSALSEPCERLLSLIRSGVKAAVEAGTVLVRTRLEAVHDAHAAERLPRGVIRNVKHELTIALAELLFAPSLNTGHTLTPVSSDTGAHSAETLSSLIGPAAVTCVEASFVVVVASGKAGADRAAAQLWTIVTDDLIGCTVSVTDSNLSDAIIDDAVGIHTVIGADTGADAVQGDRQYGSPRLLQPELRVSQRIGSSKPLWQAITLVAKPGTATVTVTYPSLKCGGTWTFVKGHRHLAWFRETITYGKKACVDGGMIAVTPIESNYLTFSYFQSGDGKLASWSTLSKMDAVSPTPPMAPPLPEPPTDVGPEPPTDSKTLEKRR
jgi:hypothetical protein